MSGKRKESLELESEKVLKDVGEFLKIFTSTLDFGVALLSWTKIAMRQTNFIEELKSIFKWNLSSFIPVSDNTKNISINFRQMKSNWN